MRERRIFPHPRRGSRTCLLLPRVHGKKLFDDVHVAALPGNSFIRPEKLEYGGHVGSDEIGVMSAKDTHVVSVDAARSFPFPHGGREKRGQDGNFGLQLAERFLIDAIVVGGVVVFDVLRENSTFEKFFVKGLPDIDVTVRMQKGFRLLAIGVQLGQCPKGGIEFGEVDQLLKPVPSAGFAFEGVLSRHNMLKINSNWFESCQHRRFSTKTTLLRSVIVFHSLASTG